MRIADIAIFMFIFQAVLGALNTVSFLHAANITSNINETLSQINNTVKQYSLNISCSDVDVTCQIQLAVQQFYLTTLKPVADVLWAFGKAIFIGEFMRDILAPLDPNNSMNDLYLALDAIGGMIFVYGLVQFIRGFSFKVSR